MKTFFVILLFTCCVGLIAFTKFPGAGITKGVEHTLEYFRTQSTQFAITTAGLKEEINKINNDPSSIANAKEVLKKCRLQYKSIEFFLTYFLSSTSLFYNQPNKVETEEPNLEYHEPVGLQVIEAILFDSAATGRKKELLEQAELINSSANDIHALLYNLKIDDKRILESIRLELIRIITLGITGFDTPELKTGIVESASALNSIKIILSPFVSDKSKEADSVNNYLNVALRLLEQNNDFNSFDRLDFFTRAALPLEYHLGLLIEQKDLQINTTVALNYNARNLFSPDAIAMVNKQSINPALAALGQKLFFEKGLSGNSTRSCATCHQPEKYFTDQIPKSITLNGISTVARNAPTLFYSAYQYAQFWDGRAKDLHDQINTVLINPTEMGADHIIILKRLKNIKQYVESFNKAFPGEKTNPITIRNISASITSFMETLSPFNSPFDKYLGGDKNALTKQQVKGFNLFMGKAQCGTCHYAPVFNGLIPPLYSRTEFEVLGTTKNTDFNKPESDPDSGRYTTYPTLYYIGAFKTPTVRNAAKTAPYMHNGAFTTLEQVVEFYNKGGGVGLGLNIPTQTLSSKPLKLDSTEVNDIISFLSALTDSYTLPSKTDK